MEGTSLSEHNNWIPMVLAKSGAEKQKAFLVLHNTRQQRWNLMVSFLARIKVKSEPYNPRFVSVCFFFKLNIFQL